MLPVVAETEAEGFEAVGLFARVLVRLARGGYGDAESRAVVEVDEAVRVERRAGGMAAVVYASLPICARSASRRRSGMQPH